MDYQNGNYSAYFENTEYLLEDDEFDTGETSNCHPQEATVFDFFIGAHEREFMSQKQNKLLDPLHVQSNDKDEFEKKLWMVYNSVLRQEILYQRAEEGCEERVEWSPVTKPSWEDEDRFFAVHFKRNVVRLSDLNDDFLESMNGLTVKLSVLVYSDSLLSAKDYDRAKEVLALGKHSGGLKDRSGVQMLIKV